MTEIKEFPPHAKSTLARAISDLERYANDSNELEEIRSRDLASLDVLKGWGLLAVSEREHLERYRAASCFIDELCALWDSVYPAGL